MYTEVICPQFHGNKGLGVNIAPRNKLSQDQVAMMVFLICIQRNDDISIISQLGTSFLI